MIKGSKLRVLASVLLPVSILALAVSMAMVQDVGAIDGPVPCIYTGFVSVDGVLVDPDTGVRVVQDSEVLGETTTGLWALADNEFYLDSKSAVPGSEVGIEVFVDCGGGDVWLLAGLANHGQWLQIVDVGDLNATCSGCILTVVADPDTCGDVTGGGAYECGTWQPINATATDPCCYFVNWIGEDIANPDVASTTVLVDENKTVTANFTSYQYDLTVTSSGCCPVDVENLPGGTETVSANSSETFYDIPCDTDITLTADDSDSCCVFQNWTGNASGSTNPETVTMDGDKSVTANCSTLEYELTVLASPVAGGNVTGTGTYNCCTNATITATASGNYTFSHWTGDPEIADPDSASTTVHIDGATTVTGHFSSGETIHINVNPFLFVYPWANCSLPDALTNIGPPITGYPEAYDVVTLVWGTADVEGEWKWVSFYPDSGAGTLGTLGLEEGKPYIMHVTEGGVCKYWERCVQ